MNYCIDLYKNFKCKGCECPDTCCYGWEILVDEETASLYTKEKGEFGKRLRRGVTAFGDKAIRKKLNGRCPFEQKNGLCQLQAMGKEEYMPKVCRLYPRRILEYSGLKEITLEMACPEVARLVLERKERLVFEECTEEFPTLWTLENDSIEFRECLLQTREKILDLIWSDADLGAVLYSVYDYSYRMYHELGINDLKGMMSVESKINTSDRTLLFGFSTLDKLISHNLSDFRLAYAVPRLHKRIKSYHKLFDKLTEKQADELFENSMHEMMRRGLVDTKKYRAYLSFCIQQLYMTAYEDYYIIRPVLLSLAYTQILMIFDVCAYLTGGEQAMSHENQALELGSLERRMRHNVSVRDGMLERIRTDFIEPGIL